MEIKAVILSILTACGGFALSKPLLKIEVQSRVGRQIGDRAISSTLAQLNKSGSVGIRKDVVTSNPLWFRVAA